MQHYLIFLPLLAQHKYSLLFLGLFFGGDTALLIGIYFSIIGVMALWYVVALTFVASLLADAIWYWVGMSLSYKQLKRLPYFRVHTHYITALEKFLDKHALKTLFYSKFIYGTRMLIQIICGTHGVDLWDYFSINTIGTLMWIGVFLAISRFISVNLSSFRHVAHGIELVFLAVVIIIIAINVLVKHMFTKELNKDRNE
jgi:membrane protein DedA with SNARE-associated domain